MSKISCQQLTNLVEKISILKVKFGDDLRGRQINDAKTTIGKINAELGPVLEILPSDYSRFEIIDRIPLTLPGKSVNSTSIIESRDGKSFIVLARSGNYEGTRDKWIEYHTLMVVDKKDGSLKLERRLSGGKDDELNRNLFESANGQIVIAEGNSIKAITRHNNELRVIADTSGDVAAFQLLPDGKRIICGGENEKNLTIIDLETGREIHEIKADNVFAVLQGIRVFEDHNEILIHFAAKSVLYDLATFEEIKSYNYATNLDTMDVVRLPDGSLVFANNKNLIVIPREGDGRRLAHSNEFNDLVSNIIPSEDGKYFISSSSTTIKVWDSNNLEQIAELTTSLPYNIKALKGPNILISNRTGEVEIWDYHKDKIYRYFSESANTAPETAILKNGNIATLTGKREICVIGRKRNGKA